MTKESKLTAFILDLDKMLPVYMGYMLRGYTVKVKDESILLVVKATNKKGQNLVTFIEAQTAEDCFTYLGTAMSSTAAPLKWRPDKFMP